MPGEVIRATEEEKQFQIETLENHYMSAHTETGKRCFVNYTGSSYS